jgi:transcriptional regulator with XRE-family HTH domain
MGMKKTRADSAVRRAFAARLRAARVTAGFETNADLAREIGVEAETYNRWERGETEPGLASLSKIRRATGVSLDWLVAGDQRATEPENPYPTKNDSHQPRVSRATRAAAS